MDKETTIQWITQRIIDEQRKHSKTIEEWQEIAARKIYKELSEDAEIPTGTLIRDIEDGDCYYEGIWQGDGKYLVTRIVWNNIESLTPEEDKIIGTIIPPKWWFVDIQNKD